MRALLDINVLIALLDAAHIHHAQAKTCLAREIHHGWASCPITQNGCVRILSSPAYPGRFSPSEVAARLRNAMAQPAHAFWPDDLSLIDSTGIIWNLIMGHRQITDAYLLALAVAHQGCFVTFDKRINLSAIPNARETHLILLK
jgi:uncharacterized protein